MNRRHGSCRLTRQNRGLFGERAYEAIGLEGSQFTLTAPCDCGVVQPLPGGVVVTDTQYRPLSGAVASIPAIGQNEKDEVFAVVALSALALFSTTMPTASYRNTTGCDRDNRRS